MHIPTTPFVKIIDDFTPDAFHAQIVELLRGIDFTDYDFMGKRYLGVGGVTLPVRKYIERAMGCDITLTMSHVRLGNKNTPLTNYIHADNAACKYALVWYLNDPPCVTGTKFWRHKATGADHMPWPPPKDLWDAVDKDTSDESKWDATGFVKAKANRALLFDSQLFHSRWPKELPMSEDDEPRHVFVGFFNKQGEPSDEHSSVRLGRDWR